MIFINHCNNDIDKKISTKDSSGNLPIVVAREYANAKLSIPNNSSRWVGLIKSSYASNNNYTQLGAVAAHVGDYTSSEPNACSIARFSGSGLRLRNNSGATVTTTLSKDGESSKGDIAPFCYVLYIRKDICKRID